MKKLIALPMLAGSALTLIACSNSGATSDSNVETIEVRDNAMNTFEVEANPDNLAIFDNGQIDNLDALGLGDKIGLTASNVLPDYLSEYEALPVAGTLHEPDLERTNALDPSFAVVSTRSLDSYEALNQITPTLDMSLKPNQSHLSLVENSLNLYAGIYGLEDQAQEIIDDLTDRAIDLSQQAASSGQTALFVMFNEASLSAYGPGSRFGLVHDEFMFAPADPEIEASTHGMDISYEYILEQNPDIIFMLDRSAAILEGSDEAISAFYNNPIIEETTAYQNDQIIDLSSDVWYLAQGGAQAYDLMIQEASQAVE